MTTRYGDDIYFILANTDPIYSAQNGLWSDPATWVGGKVPNTKKRPVIILHNVQMDVSFSGTIDSAAGLLTRDASLPPNLAQISAVMAQSLMQLQQYAADTQNLVANLPDPLTSTETASSVWNALTATYNSPGTTGEAVQSGGGSGATAQEVWEYAVDGTTQAQESLRLSNAVLGGKVSGAGTTTNTFRDLADTKDRVVATVDASGNRTAITRNLT